MGRRLKNIPPEDAIIDVDGNVVGSWNGRDILDLHREITRVHKRNCSLVDSLMPHRGQIPADIACILGMYDCGFAVWGCDIHGNCIVDDFKSYNFIFANVDDIRCHFVRQGGFRLDIIHPDNFNSLAAV